MFSFAFGSLCGLIRSASNESDQIAPHWIPICGKTMSTFNDRLILGALFCTQTVFLACCVKATWSNMLRRSPEISRRIQNASVAVPNAAPGKK